MKMQFIGWSSLAALLMAMSSAVFAHDTLSSAAPKSGSTLESSPQKIELQFHDAAHLTSVVAVGADMSEHRLEFKAGANTHTFEVADPKLEAGRNEVRWKALSKDGHVISGVLIYVIKPAAKHS